MENFIHLRAAGRTDVGRKRTNNEDAFGSWPEAGLFCVADGMGGGEDGEIASAAVVRELDGIAARLKNAALSVRVGRVMKAVNAASAWIYDHALVRRLKSCGSTFVGLCFNAVDPAAAMALHAGDSRLYRLRDGKVEQLTKDHSAAALIGAEDESQISPIFRGMILRAVGVEPTVELERTPVEVRAGDHFILCSDGLYRMVEDGLVAACVESGGTEDEIVTRLVDAANAAGGIDNVTVVMVTVGKLPPPAPASGWPGWVRTLMSWVGIRTA